jgi:aminopeptidase N
LAGVKVMRLNLLNTIFDQKNGRLIPHRLNLRRVTQDGQEVRFDHRENELLLELSNSAHVGQPLRLRFEADGDFLIHPHGDNRWELGNEPWFPSTEIEGMRLQGTARIRSEKPFLPMASGRVTGRREEGAFHILETQLDQPNWSFFIVAGSYFMEDEVRNGVTVRVANYAHKPGSEGNKLARLAHGIIAFYEALLGPFPVKELNVVQRNEWGAGQAPSGFLFMSNEAFNPLLGTQNQWFSRGVNQRYAHEIAHQYWGNQVLIASDEENWISEAFAQYCSALFIRSAKGEGEFNRLISGWVALARVQSEWVTIPTSFRARDLDDPSRSARIRQALVYGKGVVLLNRIHTEIGDQAFATLLRSYQKSLKGRPGTTQDLINLIKIITKRDYTGFFDQYLWTTAMPN